MCVSYLLDWSNGQPPLLLALVLLVTAVASFCALTGLHLGLRLAATAMVVGVAGASGYALAGAVIFSLPIQWNKPTGGDIAFAWGTHAVEAFRAIGLLALPWCLVAWLIRRSSKNVG